MEGHQGHVDHHSAHQAGHDVNHSNHHHPLATEMPSSGEIMHDAHHDHQETGTNGGHMMMMMYFHGGCEEVILFDFWRIDSVGGLIGSMFVCFLMGIIYEGLKFWREHLMRGNFKRVTYDRVPRMETGATSAQSPSTETSLSDNGDGIRPVEEPPRRSSTTTDQSMIKVIETNMCSLGHLALTAMHFVQLTLAYFLMLIVMTFNSWLCLAVISGATAGYFLFGWRKSVVVDVGGEHCH